MVIYGGGPTLQICIQPRGVVPLLFGSACLADRDVRMDSSHIVYLQRGETSDRFVNGQTSCEGAKLAKTSIQGSAFPQLGHVRETAFGPMFLVERLHGTLGLWLTDTSFIV